MRPIAGKSWVSLAWRWLRPALTLTLFRQSGLQRRRIEPALQRILWIYKGTPQIGDALMDLSARVLLRSRTTRIDLLTDPHLAQLFGADDIFTAVHSDAALLPSAGYDLVILDSFKARCLKEKLRHWPRLPFVTMRGFFSGPEFNRTQFSFFRMQQLLVDPAPPNPQSMLPHLVTTAEDQTCAAALAIGSSAIAFAIGGAVAARTYTKWDAVIAEMLAGDAALQVVLLGSANAVTMAKKIIARVREPERLINCTDAYTLGQTMAILQRCRLAVCCDGGLLHLAHAARLPTVALFDEAVDPVMRMTAANRSVTLQSCGTVDGLSSQQITTAIRQALAI